MKVLLLSVMFPSEEFPGFGTFVKNWEDGMCAQGISVVREVINHRAKGFRKWAAYMKYGVRAARAAVRRDIDLVYVHYATLSLFPLVFVSPFMRSPWVINAHGTDIMSSHWLSRFLLRCNRRLLQRAALVVVPSTYLEQEVRARVPGCRLFISPSAGIDSKVFYQRPNLRDPEGALTLGFASRLLEAKGWRDFLDAVGRLKQTYPRLEMYVMIAGGGPDAKTLEEKLADEKHDFEVKYVGELDQKQLAEFYRELSLFVFPSRMPESLGLAVLEAMACGIPVVASAVGAIPEFVKPGRTGFLCRPGQPKELSYSISQYLALDCHKREEMSENCVRLAQRYSSDQVQECLARELQVVLDTQSRQKQKNGRTLH